MEDNPCPVCYEEYSNKKYKIEICGNDHCICYDCLSNLRVHNINKCPICRQYIKYELIKYIDDGKPIWHIPIIRINFQNSQFVRKRVWGIRDD